jgi:bacillithiol biosynthesis deacetylase BshB1
VSARDRPSSPVDLLAIAAHPDDVELTCAGTLIKMQRRGYQTGIVDLTNGEMGTRGDAETRRKESQDAARVMGVAVRLRAELPDAHLHNTDETRRVVVELIRMLRPRVVILPFPVGRHPDHRVASDLGRDACFLAGLARYDARREPYKPEKVLYALAYREDPVKPSFVVDISEEFDTKLRAIRCYASQFDGAESAGEIFPTGQALYDLVRIQNAHYGSLIRAAYGEPFVTQETVRIDDVVAMGVRSL